jgi:hypothetical protein
MAHRTLLSLSARSFTMIAHEGIAMIFKFKYQTGGDLIMVQGEEVHAGLSQKSRQI